MLSKSLASGPNDAPYSVQLDRGSSLTFNATKLEAHEQVLSYYADNLGPGSHNVKIVNQLYRVRV